MYTSRHACRVQLGWHSLLFSFCAASTPIYFRLQLNIYINPLFSNFSIKHLTVTLSHIPCSCRQIRDVWSRVSIPALHNHTSSVCGSDTACCKTTKYANGFERQKQFFFFNHNQENWLAFLRSAGSRKWPDLKMIYFIFSSLKYTKS